MMFKSAPSALAIAALLGLITTVSAQDTLSPQINTLPPIGKYFFK